MLKQVIKAVVAGILFSVASSGFAAQVKLGNPGAGVKVLGAGLVPWAAATSPAWTSISSVATTFSATQGQVRVILSMPTAVFTASAISANCKLLSTILASDATTTYVVATKLVGKDATNDSKELMALANSAALSGVDVMLWMEAGGSTCDMGSFYVLK